MSNPWFRMYSEFADDPKVQMMPEELQRRLVMLFCDRCKGPIEEALLAFHWRISNEELQKTKSAFLQQGFIDENWELLNWDKRQYQSDSSSERVKRYRDRRSASGLSRGSNVNDPALYERDGKKCIYCLSPLQLCIDHIFPIVLGGTDHSDNLAVSCKKCNSGKAGRTPEMAGYVIKNKEASRRYRMYVTANNLPVTVTVTAPDTEQNRTEQEPKASCRPAVRPEEFANAWNRHRGSLPKVTEFSESRRKKAQARIRQGITVEKFTAAVRACTQTPHLFGANARGWVATFDWLIENDRNVLKVLEGNYAGNGGDRATSGINRAQERTNANVAAAKAALDRIRMADGDAGGSAGSSGGGPEHGGI